MSLICKPDIKIEKGIRAYFRNMIINLKYCSNAHKHDQWMEAYLKRENKDDRDELESLQEDVENDYYNQEVEKGKRYSHLSTSLRNGDKEIKDIRKKEVYRTLSDIQIAVHVFIFISFFIASFINTSIDIRTEYLVGATVYFLYIFNMVIARFKAI